MNELMTRLIIIFFILTSLTTVSYASFPVTENNTSVVSTVVNFQDPDDEEDDGDDTSLLEYILIGILFFGALGFSLYFIIRAWRRAWRDRVKWVRILTFIVLGFLTLIGLLSILCSLGDGCIYNMQ